TLPAPGPRAVSHAHVEMFPRCGLVPPPPAVPLLPAVPTTAVLPPLPPLPPPCPPVPRITNPPPPPAPVPGSGCATGVQAPIMHSCPPGQTTSVQASWQLPPTHTWPAGQFLFSQPVSRQTPLVMLQL